MPALPALPPPTLSLNGNTVNVAFFGLQAGTSYIVQRSFNLQAWTNLSQITSLTPTYSEPKPAGQPRVYYRLAK